MSRIGKLPIAIPEGVEVTINGQVVTAKGPLGTEVVEVRPEITVTKEENTIVVKRANDDRRSRSLHGLSRTLVANAVNGVKNGFEKKLEIVGVGYRAAMQGNTLNLALGYSHPVEMIDPEGVETVLEGQNIIIVKGIDKEKVGQFAAEIRDKRRPEPYKGKGIKYADETIRRKVGKTGKK